MGAFDWLFGTPDPPNPVNSRGDTLTQTQRNALLGHFKATGDRDSSEANSFLALSPTQVSEMLNNWMTAGGPPKPLDPSKIFGDQQAMAGVEAKAAAGQGVAGLFGFGKTIGSMAPMTSGVPYSVGPAPKISLNPIFNPSYGGKFSGGSGR